MPNFGRAFPLLIASLLTLAACSDNIINAVFTFNVDREYAATVPANAPAGQPSQFVFFTGLELDKELESNKTSASLVRSARASRVLVTSLDSTMMLGGLTSAALALSTADRGVTIGQIDNIPETTGIAMYLPLSDSDLTFLFRDTSAQAVLTVTPRTTSSSPRALNVGFTITATALPR